MHSEVLDWIYCCRKLGPTSLPPRLLQLDYLLMFVGTLCAAGAGVVMPIFSIIFGDILDAFHSPNPTAEVHMVLASIEVPHDAW